MRALPGAQCDEQLLVQRLRVGRGDAELPELRDRIAAGVDLFTAGTTQKDDQTIVIARTS